MARQKQEARRVVPVEVADFNGQMAEALRSAPWWMVSIAFHVFVVVLSSLFQADVVKVATPPMINVEYGAAGTPPEIDKLIDEDPVESIVPSDVPAVEPVVKTDGEIAEKNVSDDDVPTDTSRAGEGRGETVFDGLSTNGIIGTGGGVGGATLATGSEVIAAHAP